MTVYSDINQFLVELGTPSKLPGPWAGNECAAAFFDLLHTPAELLKRLRKKFNVEDLRRAGVVTVSGKKTVRLNPQLAKNLLYILALRRAAGEKPYDLVAGSSSLRNRTLSSVLRDHHIKELLQSTAQQLVVVTTPEDLAVLISAGIPAAPAGGLRLHELRGPRLKCFCKLLRLRDWRRGPVTAELEAAAQSPTDSAVDQSPGTAGAPATAEPQATADDREDESAAAAGAEDRADDPGDEVAEAEPGEDSKDDLEDEFAETDEPKDYARELKDEFYEEADSPETGEEEDAAADFEAQQREWAEESARREESLRHNSIALVLVNWSPSKLELGDVPAILEARDQLRVVEEHTELEMDDFRVWSPALLKRLRFSVAQRERSRIADILSASLDKDCSPLDSSSIGSPPGPTTYAEAFLACCAPSVDPDFDPFREEKWKQALKILQEESVASILNEAQKTPDALERSLLNLLASLNGTLHPPLLQLARDVADRCGPERGAGARGLLEEQLKPLLALANQVRGIIREIDSRRTKRRR
jgi:hypothetical protein